MVVFSDLMVIEQGVSGIEMFHVVWKWITFITVKTLNRPDELLCGLFLLFASRVLRFGKSIV